MSEREVSQSPCHWETLNGNRSASESVVVSSTKKTDFSIESLLKIPYLCRQSNYYLNERKDLKDFDVARFGFNFTQNLTNSHKYKTHSDEEKDNLGKVQGNTEEHVDRAGDHGIEDGKEFSWLYCSRFKPPKLPRSKKRGGCKRYGRGPRIPFAPYQITVLENAFKKSQYLSPDGISRLAESLFLTETRVKIWLQNRRARFRREMGKTDHPCHSSSP